MNSVEPVLSYPVGVIIGVIKPNITTIFLTFSLVTPLMVFIFWIATFVISNMLGKPIVLFVTEWNIIIIYPDQLSIVPFMLTSNSIKTDFTVFTITIIDQVRDTKSRKEKESMYINRLKTYLPFGLNVISKQ